MSDSLSRLKARAKYRELVEHGICVTCRRDLAEDGRRTCRVCFASVRKTQAKRRSALKAGGRCQDCAKPARAGRLFCDRDLARRRAMAAKQRTAAKP